MKPQQIRKFVMRYLEATDCRIIEKSPAHVTVKFSPEADKALTNRSYYWSFIERTGAEPETMTCTFVFDPEKMRQNPDNDNKQAGTVPSSGSILGAYFGIIPTAFSGRVAQDIVTYGSRRLEQIFAAVKAKGKYICLFEEPEAQKRTSAVSSGYTTWLGVNFKVELLCDMKREELHSLGISLATGEIVEQFHPFMLAKRLSPRLPANTHITRGSLTLHKGLVQLEHHLEKRLKTYDHDWAAKAQERMGAELARIDSYYDDMLKTAEDDNKPLIAEQYANRKAEIEWQYRPRIQVSVINCGLFHLQSEPAAAL